MILHDPAVTFVGGLIVGAICVALPWWAVSSASDGYREIEALKGERNNALARATESDGWRHVAAYYLGSYVDTHTPEECRAEALRRVFAGQALDDIEERIRAITSGERDD